MTSPDNDMSASLVALRREHPKLTAVAGNHDLAVAGALGLVHAPAACNWCAGTAGSGARYGAECKASAMRYVVFGAGAVGGAIGGRLFEHGHEVVLVARGPHLEALRARGLELRSPDAAVTLPIPAVDGPGRVDFGPDDVVLLATKSQDTAGALSSLRGAAPPATPVVCVQNGVENERSALRLAHDVYGAVVMVPAASTFLMTWLNVSAMYISPLASNVMAWLSV